MTTINSSTASSAQLLALRQELFAKADTSADGTLSVDEFQKISSSALQQTGIINTSEPDTSSSLKAIFNKLDADGDGKLTQDEIEQGATLTTTIQNVLLQIQEFQNGSMFSSFLGGNSDDSDLSSIFNSGFESSSTPSLFGGSSSNSDGGLSALISQLMAKYQNTDTGTDTADTTPATGSTVSQSA